jgi:hypothetical protein
MCTAAELLHHHAVHMQTVDAVHTLLIMMMFNNRMQRHCTADTKPGRPAEYI